MNRKNMLVVAGVAAAVVAILLVVRDPIGSAGAVRQGWGLLTSAVTAVANSLITFFQHVMRG